MSKNIAQVYATNPITSFVGTELIYLGVAPYGPTDDGACLFSEVQTGMFGAGVAGQILTSNGAGMTPSFQAAPTSGLTQGQVMAIASIGV